MDLYTSLTRLKMEMNDGVLPPMTPLPASAREYLDPTLTIGMGALQADTVRGLRCPVRGCGHWFHNLTHHLNRQHSAIGGADAVMAVLGIPSTARLVSPALSAKYSEACRRRNALHGNPMGRGVGALKQARAKAGPSRSKAAASIGGRNLRDRCEAQVAHKLIDLEHKIGRSPAIADAERAYGRGFVSEVIKVWGSWNSCKAQCGLAVVTHGHTRLDIYTALNEFHRIHGRLPTSTEVGSGSESVPLIPRYETILKALGVASYPVAMQMVADALAIEHEPIPIGRQPTPKTTHACAECGSEYYKRRKQQQFCGKSCARRSQHRPPSRAA
jgi:hypothetical protein